VDDLNVLRVIACGLGSQARRAIEGHGLRVLHIVNLEGREGGSEGGRVEWMILTSSGFLPAALGLSARRNQTSRLVGAVHCAPGKEGGGREGGVSG